MITSSALKSGAGTTDRAFFLYADAITARCWNQKGAKYAIGVSLDTDFALGSNDFDYGENINFV